MIGAVVTTFYAVYVYAGTLLRQRQAIAAALSLWCYHASGN